MNPIVTALLFLYAFMYIGVSARAENAKMALVYSAAATAITAMALMSVSLP